VEKAPGTVIFFGAIGLTTPLQPENGLYREYTRLNANEINRLLTQPNLTDQVVSVCSSSIWFIYENSRSFAVNCFFQVKRISTPCRFQ